MLNLKLYFLKKIETLSNHDKYINQLSRKICTL